MSEHLTFVVIDDVENEDKTDGSPNTKASHPKMILNTLEARDSVDQSSSNVLFQKSFPAEEQAEPRLDYNHFGSLQMAADFNKKAV